MKRPTLHPIGSRDDFGVPTRTDLQQPAPSPKALRERRQQERVAPRLQDVPVCNSTTRGSYAGAELAPFSARPGAMDAFALPSRQMGRLVHPERGT